MFLAPDIEERVRFMETRRAVYLCQLHSWRDDVGTMTNMFQVCKVEESWFVRVNLDVCTSLTGLDPTGKPRVLAPATKGVTFVPIIEKGERYGWNAGGRSWK